MKNNYFEVIRGGTNTTFQDEGRDNLYHIGIPFSGAMDRRNFYLGNKLVNNNLNAPIIEFAYQGPCLKYTGDKLNIAITGDVVFKIKKKDLELDGNCYESYQLESGDEINIISTNKSVYGYLAVGAKIDINYQTLFLLLGIVLFILNGLWCALLLGLLCARYRDLNPTVGSIIQLSFFVTPIIWDPSLLPDRQFILLYNPFYHFIESIRGPILGDTVPIETWLILLCITIVGWCIIIPTAAKMKRKLVYWL